MATFSHRGRREEERTSVTNESITGTSRSEIRTALFWPNGFDIDRIDVWDQLPLPNVVARSWNVHLSFAGHLLRSCYLIGSHEMSNRVSVLDCLGIAVRGC